MAELPPLHLHLDAGLRAAVEDALAGLHRLDAPRRLWARDASLWTDGDEGRWLDWLDLPETESRRLELYDGLAREVASAPEGVSDVLLLGMGGSSLAPEVLRRTFAPAPGHPRLHVLDSTDPAQIRAAESALDLARTWFVVSSKSGSTLEPNLLLAYFLDRAALAAGASQAPRRFLAITDPGSKLEAEARRLGFRHVLAGHPGVGGRFSALSPFGLVPAALLGLDVGRLLAGAREMARACGPDVPAPENPGFVLGAVLGTLAAQGRDKVTIGTTSPVAAFGAWLEQLLAESTGKVGKGLVPVEGEPDDACACHGDDRLFVAIGAGPAWDEAIDCGAPGVSIELRDPYALGGEFLRWEIATAVAGALLGIHPFDQPDVEASKAEARRLTDAFERSGSLPADDALRLDGDGAALLAALRALVDSLRPGGYFGILAWLEMCPANESPLREMRRLVRDRRKVATVLGFGPRYLHSTGQAYKGGPDGGVFLAVTAKPLAELPVPGSRLGFAVVEAAQARGDLAVLSARGRRALAVRLGSDVRRDLYALLGLLDRALGAARP